MTYTNVLTKAGVAQFVAEWSKLWAEGSQESMLKEYGVSRNEFLHKFSDALSAEDLEKIRLLPADTYFFPTSTEEVATSPATVTFGVTFRYSIPKNSETPRLEVPSVPPTFDFYLVKPPEPKATEVSPARGENRYFTVLDDSAFLPSPETKDTKMNITEIKKPALTVARHDLPTVDCGHCVAVPVPANMFLLESQVCDRLGDHSCEENPQRQQLIPYLTLVNQDFKLFTYSRGSAGGEDKLKTKLSVGLGGHVDSAPPLGHTLHSWLIAEARRELEEEVGFVAPAQIIFDALLLDRLKETEDNGSVYVGQVHAGLLSFVSCTSAEVVKLEQGVIEHGSWVSVEELLSPEVFSRLEPWSQAAVTEYQRRADHSV